MPAFKEILLNLMKRNGLKQTDLAQELSISRQAVNKWFTKGYKPELEHIPKLLELFKITSDDFFRMLNDEDVNQTYTSQPSTQQYVSFEEALQMQKKISELQEQVIKYQAKELEEKNRQIDNKNELSPDKDTTTTSR
ncbi:helix-turn-helix domain-containing protein [Spirosoma sp. RP8]|uniref:Helix-turn-helix domain-containing protein n=1 Tax=Spirosoma liriopis TaxID=2937440 RepID=A0ABT0HL77_9BACT|nr:helix-turn-helix transcriptional regulator [Spirosoma liriopis]MCK8492931.1 helix-turn-helix domain-containing protein [Spirosoma liriopis]